MKSSKLIIGLLMIAASTKVSLAMQPHNGYLMPIEEYYRNQVIGTKARNHINEINKARAAQGLKPLSNNEELEILSELFRNPDSHTNEKPL